MPKGSPTVWADDLDPGFLCTILQCSKVVIAIHVELLVVSLFVFCFFLRKLTRRHLQLLEVGIFPAWTKRLVQKKNLQSTGSELQVEVMIMYTVRMMHVL